MSSCFRSLSFVGSQRCVFLRKLIRFYGSVHRQTRVFQIRRSNEKLITTYERLSESAPEWIILRAILKKAINDNIIINNNNINHVAYTLYCVDQLSQFFLS